MIPKLPYMFCNKSKYCLYRIGRPISCDSLIDRSSKTQDLTHSGTALNFLRFPFIDKTFFIYEKAYRFY
jgi:hypothetical protein